ncbi:hypothetical protein LTR86_004600 [Recurvomyces mirabilis]|nr:hypothetical protein LTR86_004600 [Recurvomyces mirabilis]
MAIRTFLVAALAAFAYAEKLNNCSGSCVGKAIQITGCPSTNSHCICSSPSFMETVNECVAECTAVDQEAAVSVAEGFCQAVSSTRSDLKRSKRSWGENWGEQRGGWNQPSRNSNNGGWGQSAPPSPPKPNNPPPSKGPPSSPSPPNHQPPPGPAGHDKPSPPNPGPPSKPGLPHPEQTVW